MTGDDALAWEERYGESERLWSGAPNATLVEALTGLAGRGFEPGGALDVGCGEGADVLWLASRGWRAIGVDVSPTAVARGERAAAEAGLHDRARFLAADLSAGLPTQVAEASFDLVTASFFHSHGELPRTRILRAAASRVREGGSLLLISHAAPPPWSAHRHEEMTSPAEDWAELDLDGGWALQMCTTVRRAATGPGGEQAHLDDGVLLARRLAQAPD